MRPSGKNHATLPALVLEPEAAKPLPFTPFTLRATASETGGSFELYEYGEPSPKDVRFSAALHVHRKHDHAFYILNGEFTFTLRDATVPAPKGSVVVIPRGTSHGFTLRPGSRALIFTVPAGMSGWFQEVSDGLAAGLSEAEVRARLAGKCDQTTELP